MRRTILALVTVVLLAASPAFAGGEKGNVEIGAYLGRAWLDDYSIFQPDDDMIFGGRLGYWFSEKWNLEASYQRLKTDTEFGPSGPPDVDMRIVSTRLNLVHNFGSSGSGFRPFLTLGAGLEKSDIRTYTEDSDFGWNAGGGFRIFLSDKFNLRLDGRYVRAKVGDVIDDSQGNVEATVGLGLLLGGGDEEPAAEVPVAPANQPPTVSCSPARAEILPGETVAITAVGTDPENGPLTYEWIATGGRVTGTGGSATLDFTGATPPSTATITVKVTDNAGLTATSDCSVRLLEPVKPAEAVSCISGGFPRNLSRLGNIDKACLDDVAQRLTADPRARVIIIGHADTRETSKTVSQMRADAARDYLVKERGVDVARVTTRSAGTAKPLGDATSNRRVEVWFVPEGATPPAE